MLKFLLVLILISPDGANYEETVVKFKTMEQCEAALPDVQKSMVPPGLMFVLGCHKVKGGLEV
jgi:hypothetical protein